MQTRHGAIVVIGYCLAIPTLHSEPPGKPDPAHIAGLIQQLGDLRFEKRESATKELIQLGEHALPDVRRALRMETNAEVTARAARIEAMILEGCRISRFSKMEFSVIDAGTFEMGSPDRENGHRPDETLHAVKLKSPYLIGRLEVTQEEYKAVTGSNSSAFSPNGEGQAKLPKEGAVRFPVENVSWYDAVEFCNRLSAEEGYKPYYKIADPEIKDGSIRSAKIVRIGGNGYRLPTEAEWERACRAGSSRRFALGDTAQKTFGNFKIISTGGYGESTIPSQGRTTTVGTHAKNKWSLGDMHGNVAEWCDDWYDKDYYAKSAADDPTGPAEGTHRVVRGGSWMVTDTNCRSASRHSLTPDDRKDFVGFRVARTP